MSHNVSSDSRKTKQISYISWYIYTEKLKKKNLEKMKTIKTKKKEKKKQINKNKNCIQIKEKKEKENWIKNFFWLVCVAKTESINKLQILTILSHIKYESVKYICFVEASDI